jgi:hypothetical protein
MPLKSATTTSIRAKPEDRTMLHALRQGEITIRQPQARCSPGNHLRHVLDAEGKLVMEAILETKAETILQFIHGLRGSLQVTSTKAAAQKFHPVVFHLM